MASPFPRALPWTDIALHFQDNLRRSYTLPLQGNLRRSVITPHRGNEHSVLFFPPCRGGFILAQGNALGICATLSCGLKGHLNPTYTVHHIQPRIFSRTREIPLENFASCDVQPVH